MLTSRTESNEESDVKMATWDLLINTITAMYTISVFTILWKENIFYRSAAMSLVGAGVGYTTAVAVNTIQRLGWSEIIEGNYLLLIPFLMGPLFVLRISKTYGWFSRYPTSILVGVMIGVSMSTYIKSQFLDLISASILPMFNVADPLTGLNNALTFVIVVCVVSYMIFTMPRLSASRPMQTVLRLARFFMMITFGATFGSTIMGRVTSFLGRMEFLLFEWLR